MIVSMLTSIHSRESDLVAVDFCLCFCFSSEEVEIVIVLLCTVGVLECLNGHFSARRIDDKTAGRGFLSIELCHDIEIEAVRTLAPSGIIGIAIAHVRFVNLRWEIGGQ